jgi:hypothetical protein
MNTVIGLYPHDRELRHKARYQDFQREDLKCQHWRQDDS